MSYLDEEKLNYEYYQIKYNEEPTEHKCLFNAENETKKKKKEKSKGKDKDKDKDKNYSLINILENIMIQIYKKDYLDEQNEELANKKKNKSLKGDIEASAFQSGTPCGIF